mmetsp:Transcript_20030/g.62302  ORF Transcript_20030/g.62302 Transcript_20030/m.62302 type:complete len:218 (-) Transcript_20030:15-668(-)
MSESRLNSRSCITCPMCWLSCTYEMKLARPVRASCTLIPRIASSVVSTCSSTCASLTVCMSAYEKASRSSTSSSLCSSARATRITSRRSSLVRLPSVRYTQSIASVCSALATTAGSGPARTGADAKSRESNERGARALGSPRAKPRTTSMSARSCSHVMPHSTTAPESKTNASAGASSRAASAGASVGGNRTCIASFTPGSLATTCSLRRRKLSSAA